MTIYFRHLKTSLLAVSMLAAVLSTGQAAAACQVTLSNSNLDFGRVMQPAGKDVLNVGNMHALGNRTITLNAICPEGSRLALSLRGAQLGEQFKFAKQGNISVSLSNAHLDGRRVDLAAIKALGAVPGGFASTMVLVPGDQVVPISAGSLAQGSMLSVQIEVKPLVPTTELQTRDATTLESNLSFEVRTY